MNDDPTQAGGPQDGGAPEIYQPSPPVDPATGFPEAQDKDPRVTWGLVIEVLDAFERHGYRKSASDQDVGQAIGLIGRAARVYSGQDDTGPGQPRSRLGDPGPGVAQPGGGWISGTSGSTP